MKKSLRYILFAATVLIAITSLFLLSKRNLQLREEPRVIIDPANNLHVKVSLVLKDPKPVRVKYWTSGAENAAQYSAFAEPSEVQTINVVSLLGEKEYNFRVIGSDGSESQTYQFRTGQVPRAMLKANWIDKPNDSLSGFILSQRPRLRGKEGFVYMLNFNGDPMWYQRVPGIPKLSRWTASKTILVISGNPKHERSAGDHILEFDIYGNKLLDLDLSALANPLQVHHEILDLPDGNLLALGYDEKNISQNGKGRPGVVKGDAILKLDRKGNILYRWSVFDVEDPASGKLPVDSLGEWGHANTLALDKDGNYLLSFRDWNQVWKVSSSTGQIIWRVGESGTIDMPEDFFFYGQHSVHINHRGEYMLFDNGVKNRRSRVLSFLIEEPNNRFLGKMKIDLPERLYTGKRGSAYFISEDQILVCAAESSAVGIIDTSGNVLGYAHTGVPDYYRAIYIPSLY